MISYPPLHRAPLAEGVTLATYRRDFAKDVSRFAEDPDAAAEQVEKSLVTLTSLQSEGRYKRDVNDAKQDNCTMDEFKAMADRIREEDDHSALARLHYRNAGLDEEATAVLKDVAAQVARIAGDSEGFFFQPVVSGSDTLEGRATRFDESKGLLQVVNVSLHDTPGLDDGLLLVTPATLREISVSGGDIIRSARSTTGIYLDQPEAGWQYHQNAFPATR